MKHKQIIGAVAIILIAIGFVAYGRYNDTSGPPDVPLNFEQYQSKDGVYSVYFPAGWVMNDTRVEQEADVLRNQSYRVVLAFHSMGHDLASSKDGRKRLMDMTARDFRNDPLHTVEKVKKLKIAGRQAQVVSGRYLDEPEYWTFANYTIFLSEGRVFTLTTNILEKHVDKYRETVEEIVGSLRF